MKVLQSGLTWFENIIYKQKCHSSLAIFSRKFQVDALLIQQQSYSVALLHCQGISFLF